MCCLAEFIVKYVLIIANIIFALAGLTIIGLASAAHHQLNQIHDVIPGYLSFLTISIIIIGCIIFIIAFCACCGAIKESQCMLVTYAVFMGILAAVKIYFTVVIFKFLGSAAATVTEWLTKAFLEENARPAFNAMETLFQCCGTVGAGAYPILGQTIPPSCCYNPDMVPTQCDSLNSYQGCNTKVGDYFETFGGAIGAVLIVVIIIECVCMLSGLFLSCQIRSRRYA